MSSLPTTAAELKHQLDVTRLERAIGQLEVADLPITHNFTKNGMYCRTLFIPRNCVLVGAVHKYEHISLLVEGEMSLLTPEGVKRVSGPMLQIAQPGLKRAGFAHTDTLWLTVHKTECTNPDTIEDVLTTKTYAEYLEYADALLAIEGGKE